MLGKTVWAMLIVILMAGPASAQGGITGLPGYSNAIRTDQEKRNDKEIDRAYQSTIKGPDAVKKSDPWGDVRPAPPAEAKNKKKQ